MEQFADLEGTAAALYRAAGYDDGEPAPVVALATRLLGPGCVQRVHAGALPGDAALVTVHGERRIYVRRGLPPVRLRFAVAHELAHWALGECAPGAELEARCDALAACLVAPRRAFLRALRETDRYHELAGRFATTESCVALRLGEVSGAPTALVAPSCVRVRGEAYGWPGETELRALASKPRVPGLRKARLRDDRRRVAMRVAE